MKSFLIKMPYKEVISMQKEHKKRTNDNHKEICDILLQENDENMSNIWNSYLKHKDYRNIYR